MKIGRIDPFFKIKIKIKSRPILTSLYDFYLWINAQSLAAIGVKRNKQAFGGGCWMVNDQSGGIETTKENAVHQVIFN